MEKKAPIKLSSDIPKRSIWDCDSSLYDSFELKSFERQLSSAIASRTLSMPHFPDRRFPPPELTKKPTSKISRSIHRLVRAVFPTKNNDVVRNNNTLFSRQSSKKGFYVVYDKSSTLSAIPEASRYDGVSPEIRSLMRRTTSDRISASTSFGISCAP